jgi:hypothetical protein
MEPLMPRWEEVFPNHGFDQEATPRWLMVGHRSVNLVSLANGAGLVVKSVSTHIATVSEADGTGAGVRDFMITGECPGTTFVDAYAGPDSRKPAARLEVCVKPARPLKIAFQFVNDVSTKAALLVPDLLKALNDTFLGQANIEFAAARVGPIHFTYSLNPILKEQGYAANIRATGKWLELVAEGDLGADINVFFLPWDVPAPKRSSQMFVLERDCVCDEGMTVDKLKVALPHTVGYMLGCRPTYNDGQKHHLMYWSRAEGVATGSIGFIPKDCVNAMNPT